MAVPSSLGTPVSVFLLGDSLYHFNSQTHVGYGTHTCAVIPDPIARSRLPSAEWICPTGICNAPPESSWHTGFKVTTTHVVYRTSSRLEIYCSLCVTSCYLCSDQVNLWSRLPRNDKGGISCPLLCVSPPLEPRMITHFLCSLHDTWQAGTPEGFLGSLELVLWLEIVLQCQQFWCSSLPSVNVRSLCFPV